MSWKTKVVKAAPLPVAAIIILFLVVDYSFAIYQPNPVYYSVRREELLRVSGQNMKVFQVQWIVASSREGTPVYADDSLSSVNYRAPFLQRFEVLRKEGPRLLVKKLDAASEEEGWVRMQDMIYLPRALKRPKTGVYQKVVLTHLAEHLVPGKIGDVTFYRGPNETSAFRTRAMGTIRIAYVYEWQHNNYDDSDFVLIGSYPYIDKVSSDRGAFKKVIYGWCKTSKLFPWDSRIALVPNSDLKHPAYIFLNGPELTTFYNRAATNRSATPERKKLFTYDSEQMWLRTHWPFFLEGKLESEGQKFLRLVCHAGEVRARVSPLELKDIQKELEYLKANAKSTDVVFLIDATESMAPYIEGVAEIVNLIMKELKKNSSINSQRLRFGAAVYRDYVDLDRKFEIKTLTNNIDVIRSQLEEWSKNAYHTGTDDGDAAYPEAFFNGIYRAVEKSSYGQFNAKFLIVIGDAGNHSRGKDNLTRCFIGNHLSENWINCIMVKVKHPATGGDPEQRAMNLFRKDRYEIRKCYIQRFVTIGRKNKFDRFNKSNVAKLFATDEVDSPKVLKDQLLERHSRRISDLVDTMIEDYQRLIAGESIEPAKTRGVSEKVTPYSSTISVSQDIINPIVFDTLRKRFGSEWPKVLEELKQKRAYLTRFGYAIEYDPRSPSRPQFKNVYLFRENELKDIKYILGRTLGFLNNKMVKNLWQGLINEVYGEDYKWGKTFNQYSEMREGITYRTLSALFSKTQEQVSRMKDDEIEKIVKKIMKVRDNLKSIISNRRSKRFFGPEDDLFIWLYDNELP